MEVKQEKQQLTLQDYEARNIDINFKNIKEEEQICRKKLEQNDQDVEALVKLGFILIRYYKDKKNSISYFEKVLSINENDLDGILGKCYCILEEKKKTEFELCQIELDKCLKQKIKYWRIYYYQAMLYYLKYKDYHSKKYIRKSLKIKPNQYLALSLLALIKSEFTSEIQSAKEIIDNLIVHPENFMYDFSVFYRAGKIYEKLKEPEISIQYFMSSCQYRHNYSQAMKMIEDINKAELCALEAIKMDQKNDEAHLNLGEVRDAQDRKKEALECFFQAIELNPNNETAYLLILDQYDQMGKKQEFHDLCLKFYKNNPDSNDANFEMAYSYSTQNDLHKAIQFYKKSLSSTSFVDSYNNLGNVYFQLKDLEEAESYFMKALYYDPTDQSFNDNLNVVIDFFNLTNEQEQYDELENDEDEEQDEENNQNQNNMNQEE